MKLKSMANICDQFMVFSKKCMLFPIMNTGIRPIPNRSNIFIFNVIVVKQYGDKFYFKNVHTCINDELSCCRLLISSS